jgi:hypothetical protein
MSRVKEYFQTIFGTYKPLYYYFRDFRNRPWITVCLLWNIKDGKPYIEGRGLSICSIRDNLCKETGRNLALERAALAIICKDDSEEITEFRDSVQDTILLCDLPIEIVYKSEYEPELTDYENRLISKMKYH